jgi:hypothetical protein
MWRVLSFLGGWWCVLNAQAQVFTGGPTPWPLLPDPPKSTVQWVGDDMRINGIPTRIAKFSSPAGKAEVMAFYVAHWGRNNPKDPVNHVAVKDTGQDTTVGRPHGPFYMLVRVRDANQDGKLGSEGTISVSQLGGNTPKFDTSGVPAPDGASPVSVVEAADFGKRNKQVLFLSRASVANARRHYELSLPRQGWTLIQMQETGPALQGASYSKEQSFLGIYVKGNQQLDVAIGFDQQRQLTAINTNLISSSN